jgi:hypothetical protein
MNIFGKRLAEYVAFSKPFLGLILAVGISRLALSLGVCQIRPRSGSASRP